MAKPDDNHPSSTHEANPGNMPASQHMPPNGDHNSHHTTAGAQEKGQQKNDPSPARNRAVSIDGLYGSKEPPGSPRGANSVSGNQPEEIKMMFLREYARGIDQLLETDWYSKKGLVQLMQDGKLRSTFAGLLELMRTTTANDYEAIQKIPPIESKIIWKLMCMPRVIFDRAKNDQTNPFSDTQLQEVLHRLQIVEALICNITLDGTLASGLPRANDPTMNKYDRQLKFWRFVGELLTVSPHQRDRVDSYLFELRKMLDIYENRDVLYSIAVVRRFALAPPPEPKTLAEAAKITRDIRSQKIAKKFIEDEAAHKGTTQVMQRICGMVVRSWGLQGYAWYFPPFPVRSKTILLES